MGPGRNVAQCPAQCCVAEAKRALEKYGCENWPEEVSTTVHMLPLSHFRGSFVLGIFVTFSPNADQKDWDSRA
jgi:hypothetical protein